MRSHLDTTHEPARATHDRGPWPHLTRPDLPIRIVYIWRTPPGDAQAHAVDRLASAWRTIGWPVALGSLSLFTSTDGETVMAYAQLSSEPDADALNRLSRLMTLPADTDEAPLPAPDVKTYRVARQAVQAPNAVPGIIAFIQIDTDNHDVARTWIDAVFDAMGSEAVPPAGGLSGHFHVALDGTRVVNYAEWESEAAHEAALRPGGSIGTSPAWRRVREMPGTRRGSFKRYAAVLTLDVPARVPILRGEAHV